MTTISSPGRCSSADDREGLGAGVDFLDYLRGAGEVYCCERGRVPEVERRVRVTRS